MPFRPEQAYRLNPVVALRPEPFGALAYHFGNRRLSFLKAPELVELVRGLGGHESVHAAVSVVPQAKRATYLVALASLAEADVIVPSDVVPA